MCLDQKRQIESLEEKLLFNQAESYIREFLYDLYFHDDVKGVATFYQSIGIMEAFTHHTYPHFQEDAQYMLDHIKEYEERMGVQNIAELFEIRIVKKKKEVKIKGA